MLMLMRYVSLKRIGGINMKYVSRMIDFFMAISLGIMAILVFLNVVLRYVFSSGITWSVELSQILFMVLVFLGAIQAFKENSHIKVDVLISKVSPVWQKILAICSNVIILIVIIIVFQGSLQLVKENNVMTTPILGIPQSYVYSVGLFLSICIAVLTIGKTIEIFKKANNQDMSKD